MQADRRVKARLGGAITLGTAGGCAFPIMYQWRVRHTLRAHSWPKPRGPKAEHAAEQVPRQFPPVRRCVLGWWCASVHEP